MDTSVDMNVPINYEMLFDRKVAQAYYGVEPEPRGRYYDDDRGMFVRTSVEGGTYVQDLIQFAPDALAFTGTATPFPVPSVSRHRQVIGDDDWIHFCLRLGVGGYEEIAGYQKVDQPSRMGTIMRYPAGTEIKRFSPTDDSWRIACLWLKPHALTRLLETSASRMPSDLEWLTRDKQDSAHHISIPLSPQLYTAVNEVLNCQFRGGVRRAFVYSKYLEILATLFQGALDHGKEPSYRLSDRDLGKIYEVATILKSKIDHMEPLAALARAVGINRTKLILGFRAVYGTSVEAYWRDWRMQEANEFLRSDGLSVSEVAHRIGFSEVSSFTRAFTRQFGVPPSERRTT
ncbi:helix-turn-helix transcriptional regulator [Rhizobium miluonense]|uniref:AraC-type DNA-binding protein n=1 Tax=Rhizobium miluonense TaxID=411945 RepID=A0A1C3WCU5_9HYPH|nr:AraC family transcriptional regulator [Rhizobium miluonense]SCB37830.1 AraC-type DNA-binding protein [Rhizobium miluonense]